MHPCLKHGPGPPRARAGYFPATYFVRYLTLVFLDRSPPSAEASSRLLEAAAQPCGGGLGLGRAPAPVPRAGCSLIQKRLRAWVQTQPFSLYPFFPPLNVRTCRKLQN